MALFSNFNFHFWNLIQNYSILYAHFPISSVFSCPACMAHNHTDRFYVEMFQNHGSKKWISLKIMLFLAMQSDNANFYACKIIKVTSGFNFKKTFFFRQAAPSSKKQLKYFSNTNNSTILTPSSPPGVSREAKLSTDFEFGSEE